jgi:hypothetical protein
MSGYMMSIYSGWIQAAEKEETLKIEVVEGKLM